MSFKLRRLVILIAIASSEISGECSFPADSIKSAPAQLTAPESALSLNEAQNIPGINGNAIKVIKSSPGAAPQSIAPNEIFVRGSASEDTKFYLDGVPIPRLLCFDALSSMYNSSALEAVTMFPGAFNVEYGDAVGGIVEINGRAAKTDRWHGDIDINLIDASAFFEGPVNSQFSLLTTFRRSYIADILNFALNKASSSNLPFTTAPYSWSEVTRLDYHPSNSVTMFLTFFTVDDELKFNIQNLREASATVSSAEDEISESNTFKTILFGYDHKISGSTQNTLRLSYAQTSLRENTFSLLQQRQNINGLSFRDQFRYAGSDRLNIIGGIDVTPNLSQYGVTVLGANGLQTYSERQWISDLAIYAKAEYKPIEKLILIPGVRYDYYTDITQGEPSVRLTARYNYIPGHTLKGSIGTYSQDPQPWGQAVDSVWGNPKLPPTLGTQSVLGYEYTIIGLLNLDVQGYYNTQTDIPEQTDSIIPNARQSYNFLPVEKGRMYGLELVFHYNQGKRFFGWIAYSLSKSLRNSPVPLPSSMNPDTWNPNSWYLSPYDQTHNLIILGAWKLPWSLAFGFRCQYTTGNPISPIGITENTARYNATTGRYDQLTSASQVNRTGSLQELDIKLEKNIAYAKWTLSAYIDMQNVNYSWLNGSPPYYYTFDGFQNGNLKNIFIPSLGIKAEF